MSTYGPTPVSCPACGHTQDAVLPESANAARRPAYRDEVLAGTFMRVTCEGCGAPYVVERDLLFTHLDAGLFVLVFPSARRAEVKKLSALAREVFRRAVHYEAPPVISQLYAHLEPRLVFGYEELREKVLCNDAGLDDRYVELLKDILLAQIPGADEAGVEGLVLREVASDGKLVFAQYGRGFKAWERPLLEVAREVYDDVASWSSRALVEKAGWLKGPYVHRSMLTGTVAP